MFKKIYFTVFIIVLIHALTGCDGIYRLLQKEGAEEKDLVGEVLPFEPNSTVKEIQKLLKLYGYSPGGLDGKLGVNTRNSIEKFQKDNGLEQTRFVDQATWERLNIFSQSGLVSKGQIDIFKVQMALYSAKSFSEKVDGRLGPKTKEAIKQFQKKHHLKADGKIGYKTLTKLNAYLLPKVTKKISATSQSKAK